MPHGYVVLLFRGWRPQYARAPLQNFVPCKCCHEVLPKFSAASSVGHIWGGKGTLPGGSHTPKVVWPVTLREGDELPRWYVCTVVLGLAPPVRSPAFIKFCSWEVLPRSAAKIFSSTFDLALICFCWSGLARPVQCLHQFMYSGRACHEVLPKFGATLSFSP